ncbi:hypothetical protein KCTCHS21_05080 [Cohnella abietis]|uniref:Uncharacterized protein n=1 Tax=Cohnella abietis TaxID=2507935 RepID=A0A3T1CZB5_9BACL|nr:hypothetical protein KCTCHS21_05080 [Cohnella abietis]
MYINFINPDYNTAGTIHKIKTPKPLNLGRDEGIHKRQNHHFYILKDHYQMLVGIGSGPYENS